MHQIWLFVGALVAVYLLPGADMILLLQTGVRDGRIPAMATTVGLGAARASHVALAGLGLAALVRNSPAAFEAVRLVGVAYLIWLGIQVLRSRQVLVGERPELSGGRALLVVAARRGFMTNIANPKALLFCSVLLPQFVNTTENVGLQFINLGLILVFLGFIFDIVYALAGSAIGRFLRNSITAQAFQRWVFGTLLIACGVKLAIAR